MSNAFSVAAIQLKPARSINENLANAAALLSEAAAAGAQLAVLPENFAHYGQSDFLAIGRAESEDSGLVRQFLSQQASTNGLWLVGGTLPVAGPKPRPFARSFLLMRRLILLKAAIESQMTLPLVLVWWQLQPRCVNWA